MLSAGFCTRLQGEKMQKWLQEYIPDFIKVGDWPSFSQDLNLLDYGLWSVLEECVCAQTHQNLDSLKAAREALLVMIHELINDWSKTFAALCRSKRRSFWVTTVEMSLLKYFLNFLKILLQYLFCLLLNECLKYGQNLLLHLVLLIAAGTPCSL